MTREESLNLLADVLDCDARSLEPSAPLADFAWDSMARVSLLAGARVRGGVRLSGAALAAFRTVGDVLAALEESK